MNEVFSLIGTYGVPVGIAVLVILQFVRLVAEQGPTILTRYQNRQADIVDHQQDIEQQKLRHKELLDLSNIGSRTFTEEQLTQHLSELYSEFGSVNAFIRDTMSIQLVDIERKIDQLLLDVRPVPVLVERLAEIRMFVRSIHEQVERVINGGDAQEQEDECKKT